jgi:hypothetical protein
MFSFYLFHSFGPSLVHVAWWFCFRSPISDAELFYSRLRRNYETPAYRDSLGS